MIDWTSTAHMLQLVLFVLALFSFLLGFNMGNRL